MENTLEDLQPFLGVGLEQTAKFSLGQHGDLGKLLPRDPQDGLDLGVDLSGFGDQPAVGQGQLGLGLLQDQLIAPLGGALVLRVTPDGVLLPSVLKHQLHFCGRLWRGVFGAKLKLLDLEYGNVAVPLEYNTLPEGTYRNTKVYPSRYKVWANGPFFELDTIYGDIRSLKKMDLIVTPNVTLKIKKVEVLYGITANVTFTYQVNDERSKNQEIGLVYGKEQYPGQRTAMNESESGSHTYKRIKKNLTELSGEFTETLFLNPNSTYYLRALGRTESAGDYWNYSEQTVINTTDIDLSSLPIEAAVGVSSATSAVLQWAFPPVVDEIKVSYTDWDGEEVMDKFKPTDYSYVANLPHNKKSTIKVQLLAKGVAGPEQTIEVQTKSLMDKYVPASNTRPENVPFYNDSEFKKSLSGEWALIYGPTIGEDWSTTDLRFEYFDWWDTWLIGFADRMPACQDIENFKSLTIQGEIQTLVDILPFVNLETLSIIKGKGFSVDKTINPKVDLTVLKKLKKLNTVIIGPDVPLTKKNFDDAGLTHLTITN